MDGISSAASVFGVIQLAGSIAKICGGYIREVKDARDDIIVLQQTIAGLKGVLQELDEFLRGPHGTKLITSSSLVSNVTNCFSDLEALEKKIGPGRRKEMMSTFGIRALKWPLKRMEVDRIIQNLERYKLSFILSLQVDETMIVTGVAESVDRIDRKTDLDKLPIARGAEFDSYMDQHEDECLSGTRTELLRQISRWAVSSDGKGIFWLNGMAGTGKSTISRTVAKSLKDVESLGASFFFKRGEGDRGNATKLLPTIARQLVRRFPTLEPHIQKAIINDPDITTRSLKEQFDKLIIQPLQRIELSSRQVPAAVLVIDALDECENDNDVRVIIQLLPRLKEAKAVRLRVFLTSRPELPIHLGFQRIANHDYQDLALHEISEKVTECDISLFLKDRFAKIRLERSMPQDWPSEDIVQYLVAMSVPLFISAATVCRYIENPKWNPATRLTDLLKDQARYAETMDRTYLPILSRLLDDNNQSDQQKLLQEFQAIIGVVILLAVPLSVNTLSRFLGIDALEISNRLNSFQSVLSVPNNRDVPVRILHLSFRDFLVNSNSRFLVDEPTKHKDIAMRCLITMRGRLKKNICNLKGSGKKRTEIDTESIHQHLPPELQYSCRYWAFHLAQSMDLASVIEDVLLVLREHFLHWVEAMSLLGFGTEAVEIISLLQSIIHADNDNELSMFLHDAKRFVLKNRQIVDVAPLQLYSSGLIFTPKASIIRRIFAKDVPSWLCQLPKVRETWSADVQTLEGHSDWIGAVAFSPHGQTLASGSSDKTIKLWDPTSGQLQHTLDGHSDLICSVAFSPDGQTLASGSGDKTIRLWDPTTGQFQFTLGGHSNSVESVAFSPDGRTLASGSSDNTIKLWNLSSSQLQHTLNSHLDSVWCLAFSPDGQILASSSSDETIRLWDLTSSQLQHTLKGHSQWIDSITFSPDSRTLASGSGDETIKLWDPTSGQLLHTLEDRSNSDGFSGHSPVFRSVAFAPDGQTLASASGDAIKLWDLTTGQLQLVLEGHSNSVASVAFSPDGQTLVSGSFDKTIKLWDLLSSQIQHAPNDYSSSVQSITFSPDGRILATSTSDDETIRLWDPTTSQLQHILRDHSHRVESIAFSPHGQILASCSVDKTIKLWDPASGHLQHTLDGHFLSVRSITFSPDGQILASSSSDQTIKLWDPTSGQLQHTLEGHFDLVCSITFSLDGRNLASISYGGTIMLWNPITGQLQRTLEGHSAWIGSIAFSPDGRTLASNSDDKIKLWDPISGQLQHILDGDSLVRSVTFSPDGRTLSSESYKSITLWDPVTGQLQRTLEGHSKWTWSESNVQLSIKEKQWVCLDGERILWLPLEYRPTCLGMKGGILALGHASGKVSFLSFSQTLL